VLVRRGGTGRGGDREGGDREGGGQGGGGTTGVRTVMGLVGTWHLVCRTQSPSHD
jgi:hypothetical protein